jgi:hypothetical protein
MSAVKALNNYVDIKYLINPEVIIDREIDRK